MRLERLQLTDFRLFQSLNLDGFRRLNLLYGPNGSGKTSVLEALYLLSLGRSFRSHDPKAMIRSGAESCTVVGVFLQGSTRLSVGVQRVRSEAKPRVRVNGQSLGRLSDLVQQVPMRMLDAQSLGFLEGGPGARRSFLDWGVFHVEHGFQDCWQAARAAVKQRNALLRSGRIRGFELDAWEQRIAQEAEALDRFRGGFCQDLLPSTERWLRSLSPGGMWSEVALSYRRGWQRDQDLLQVLLESRASDIAIGHTQHGPHRADIRVTVGGRKSQDVLSRGQQKLLAVALHLAQIELVEGRTGAPLTILVDDLAAELDREHRTNVMAALSGRVERQLFISGTELELLVGDLPSAEPQTTKVFHVEHGQVNTCVQA